MKILTTCICLNAIFLNQVIFAQNCDDNVIKTAPDSRFEIIADGSEIKDKQTGLIWQRCYSGQIWNGKNCIGEVKSYGWLKALQETRKLGKGYRLPNAKEAMSIIEYSCIYPAFNTKFFSTAGDWWDSGNQKVEPIWTSTPYYILASGTGELHSNSNNGSAAVRAVRGGW